MGKSLKQRFEDSYTKYRKSISWLLDLAVDGEWVGPGVANAADYAVAAVSGADKNPAASDEVEMIRRFCDLAVFASASSIIEPIVGALSVCESPIERIFLCALWISSVEGFLTIENGFPAIVTPRTRSYGNPFGPNTLTIEPQASHGSFRVDFRVTFIREHFDLVDGERAKKTFKREVIIECDGHEFHEKTKKQAAKDKSRDRELQCSGCSVFHFTGSEIWNDPFECANQVIRFLERNSR